MNKPQGQNIQHKEYAQQYYNNFGWGHMVTRLICCCCSVTKLYPTLCDPMDWSTPSFPALHYLPEFVQTHTHWVGNAIQPSHPLLPPAPPALYFSATGSFPMSWLFPSGGQSTGASASESVLPRNIQGWFPLGLTSLIHFLVANKIISNTKRTSRFLFKTMHSLPISHNARNTLSLIPKDKKLVYPDDFKV